MTKVSSKEKLLVLEKRDKFLRIVRSYFHQMDFLEIDAPILVKAGGMESHLDPFVAVGTESNTKYFLPTSPEFYLKRVIALGAKKIFSLCPSFRDERESKSHSHQFLMLEWYRAESSLDEIIADCQNLLNKIEQEFSFSPILNKKAEKIYFSDGILVFELRDFFKKCTGYEISQIDKTEKWQKVAKSFGAQCQSDWTENDCFSYIFVTVLEKELQQFNKPVILKGYPHFQCALAELRKDGFSDRFELFINGVEIANAYNELKGKKENFERYIFFQNERKKMGKTPHTQDDLFFEAVEKMSKSAGIAFGIDRFLSLLLNCPIYECQNR